MRGPKVVTFLGHVREQKAGQKWSGTKVVWAQSGKMSGLKMVSAKSGNCRIKSTELNQRVWGLNQEYGAESRARGLNQEYRG